ncbi:MAG: ABC transporter permease [Acidimicrobiales bacterium]|nr:ABC transporter permease [Acidimicrobiales bacterium]
MILAVSVVTDFFQAVLQGVPPGTVYALVAIGFVLTYKTSGVFNFAFGAQAFASMVLFHKAADEWGWGTVPAAILSVLIFAPLLGFLLEWAVFRHLRTAPPLSTLVVSLGLTVAIPSLVTILLDFSPKSGSSPHGVVPDGRTVRYDPFGVYPFSRDELVATIVAIVAVLGLAALFRFTPVGLMMKAVVESPRMTELNGISADRVSAGAWALSSFFAGLAGVLIAPRFTTFSANEYFNIMVIAIAAAAVGKLVSLPWAFGGGLGLGVVIALVSTFLPRWTDEFAWLKPVQENVLPSIPFVVLFGVIVFVPGLRKAIGSSDPLAGVDPPRQNVASVITSAGWMFLALKAVLLLGAVAVVYTQADRTWTLLVTQAVAMGIIFLSITIITGLAGQISLCQGAFAAIGAFAVYQLGEVRGMSVLVAVVIGGAIAAAVAAALSLTLRQLTGIWVAIATLAFAFFFDAVLVKQSWIGGDSLARSRIPRPVIGTIDFQDDSNFLLLAVIVLAVCALGVYLFSRGTTGRKLRALGGSEIAARSVGISPSRARVAAFALSGFLAAVGGGMLVIGQGSVNYGTSFVPFLALFWLIVVVTFGVRQPSGAIVAAAFFILFESVFLKGEIFGWILRGEDNIPSFFPLAPDWRYILFGLGTIQYARHPEGVLAMSAAKRRARSERRAADKVVVDSAAELGTPA